MQRADAYSCWVFIKQIPTGKPEIILLSLGIGISRQSQALAVWDINDWYNLGRKVGEGILSGMKIPVINKVLTLGF